MKKKLLNNTYIHLDHVVIILSFFLSLYMKTDENELVIRRILIFRSLD
jgi:hypothetical protein